MTMLMSMANNTSDDIIVKNSNHVIVKEVSETYLEFIFC